VIAGAGAAAAGIGFALLIVVYFVVIIGSLVMTIIAVVDMAKRPDWQWKIAGQEKVLWILLVILVNPLAILSLVYWFNIRRKLVAVEQAAAAGQFGPGYMTFGGWVPGPVMVPVVPSVAPPGWQPDPSGLHPLRWWDGLQWTEQTWDGTPT